MIDWAARLKLYTWNAGIEDWLFDRPVDAWVQAHQVFRVRSVSGEASPFQVLPPRTFHSSVQFPTQETTL